MAYAVGAAEHLPVATDSFDALTVSSGVHWFDQARFFEQAARVLTAGGWMGIYDHFFVGPIEPELRAWVERDYGRRYPPPARGPRADVDLEAANQFTEFGATDYDDPIEFTHDELVAYLLSHSNTIAVSTSGIETEAETTRWLLDQTKGWFQRPGEYRSFMFRGTVRCLRRNG